MRLLSCRLIVLHGCYRVVWLYSMVVIVSSGCPPGCYRVDWLYSRVVIVSSDCTPWLLACCMAPATLGQNGSIPIDSMNLSTLISSINITFNPNKLNQHNKPNLTHHRNSSILTLLATVITLISVLCFQLPRLGGLPLQTDCRDWLLLQSRARLSISSLAAFAIQTGLIHWLSWQPLSYCSTLPITVSSQIVSKSAVNCWIAFLAQWYLCLHKSFAVL